MELKTIIVKVLAFIVSIINEDVSNSDYYLVTGDGKKIVFESREAMELYYEHTRPPMYRRQIPSGKVDNNKREQDMRRMNELYMEHLRNRMRGVQ